MDKADAIRDRRWRQGSVLLPESLPQDCLFEPPLSPTSSEAVLIVLTQDCDLVQSDFGKEPYVEVIRAVPVQNQDGNLLYGKNPRRIHFQIGEVTHEAICHERTRIPRQLLASIDSSSTHVLDSLTLELLRGWIAKRYIRPAFPDTFNGRVRQGPNGKAIRKLLERNGDWFRDIYLMCTPSDEELADGETYEIVVWPTMGSEDFDDQAMRLAATKVVTELEGLLANCSDIKVNECSLRHEGQISLDDLHYVAVWDFDDLSHRGNLTQD